MRLLLQKIAALLYGMVIRVRNMLFDKDILRGKEYDIPIICIGNITAGGTGKTPMVELMVSHFSKTHKVAVLSRGYKRKSRGYRVVDALFDHYTNVAAILGLGVSELVAAIERTCATCGIGW